MLEYKILPDSDSALRIKYTNKILKINQERRATGYTPKCHVITFGH